MSLPGRAWMDTDGKHVWWEHACLKNGERITLRWMMPWPDWHNEKGVVAPSIVCAVQGCDFHSSPLIGEPPSDFEPRSSYVGEKKC